MLALTLTLLSAQPALATESLGRDQAGDLVTPGEDAYVAVFFSIGCTECVAPVQTLRAKGLKVVLVSEDSTTDRAAVLPFLAANGIRASVIPDADGAIARRYAMTTTGGAVLFDSVGGAALVETGRVDTAQMLRLAGSLYPASARRDDERVSSADRRLRWDVRAP